MVEWVRERSEEVGECWEWQGYFTPHGNTPVTRIDKKSICVRRALAIELGLLTARSKKMAAPRCRNWRCVNPGHLQALARQVVTKRAVENRTGGKMVASRKASDRRRKRAKLTIDQVRAIRADERTFAVIGLEYGITKSAVSQIKSGHIWREYGGVFSSLVESVT